MGIEYLFLLLPVAAISGWVVGIRNGRSRKRSNDCTSLSSDYFKGLNYLLNEQPDKAIEVFIQMLDNDDEAIDVHFALGNLFRRKGEVDRAIRIHQNLIARPTLNRAQRSQALFELGNDYMKAGLLDRAENIFHELLGTQYQKAALLQLIDIYEQEKEWQHAADTARSLGRMADPHMSQTVAHYYCEQADQALHDFDYDSASRYVKKALVEDRNSVRASILEAQIDSARHNYRSAIKVLFRAIDQDPSLLSEILPLLRDAFFKGGRSGEYYETLRSLMENRHQYLLLALTTSNLVEDLFADDVVRNAVQGRLSEQADGSLVDRLLALRMSSFSIKENNDNSLPTKLLSEILSKKAAYQCSHCGFVAHTMHWHCPSCRKWNTVKPTPIQL